MSYSCCCCVCISTANYGVVENCGKFSYSAAPGCHCLTPCVEEVKGVVSMRVSMVSIVVDTKTQDNAQVRVEARVQYQVIPEKAMDAYYKFNDPEIQIRSFASNVLRGEVPKRTLDELFVIRDEIQTTMHEELSEKLEVYGFRIEATLIVDIDPTADIKAAISQTLVNAFQRTAAEHEAELAKMLQVKSAEAEFEEKRLSGKGLAEERKAIMRGLQQSIDQFVEKVPGMGAADVMNLLLMNQYFDALKDIGSTGHNRVVMMPGTQGASSSLMRDLLGAQSGGVSKTTMK